MLTYLFQTHYGKINDALPGETYTYGKGTDSSEHVRIIDWFKAYNDQVPQVFNDKELDGIKAYMRDLKEEKYARTKKYLRFIMFN